jgi:hypothetical protein
MSVKVVIKGTSFYETCSENLVKPKPSKPNPNYHQWIPWTKKEEDILKKHYPNSERQLILDLLPDRNWGTILKRANKLGLKRGRRKGSSIAKKPDKGVLGRILQAQKKVRTGR